MELSSTVNSRKQNLAFMTYRTDHLRPLAAGKNISPGRYENVKKQIAITREEKKVKSADQLRAAVKLRKGSQ